MPSNTESEYKSKMAWICPKYTKKYYNKAGDILISDAAKSEDLDKALEAINNWRSSHSLPLNIFQTLLRLKAKKIDQKFLIAQRIKRMRSIKNKLIALKTFKLTQLQDIGGCRAVVSTVADAQKLAQDYKNSDFEHTLHGENNYISNPKKSGYRSIHLIYSYANPKRPEHHGLRIEIQIRSKLQHAWATAVETVDTFTKQALKSSHGDKEWLRFFQLISGAIALQEGTAPVPNTPASKELLKKEVTKYAKKLKVIQKLEGYSAALSIPKMGRFKDAHYFLLKLDTIVKRINITQFSEHELEKATDMYMEREVEFSNQPDIHIVLVSVDMLKNLQKAYPNYFWDTTIFIKTLKQFIE